MTRSIAILVPVIAVAAVSLACIAHAPKRTFDALNAGAMPNHCAKDTGYEATSITGLQARTPAGEAERTRVSCVSEERHRGLPSTPRDLGHDPFFLHIFEFDDDGVPWNPARQAVSFEALQQQLTEPAVVVAFVHGWKNDASVCNGNLACFREVLQILAKGEKKFAGASKPRNVIGVYIGWRGGTVKYEVVNAFSFWGRKHTAHVIGDNGAVTSVVERLRTIVDTARTAENRRRTLASGPSDATSLIFIGHSFGGALLFSALGTSLNARVGAAIQNTAAQAREGRPWPRVPGRCPRPDPDASTATVAPPTTQALPETTRPIISSYKACIETTGDLVILINPAMEASRFANLAYTRNLAFDPEQVPIFMTLASEADWAVGGFFPVGQAFATISRAARSRDVWFRMEKGFGLYEPYHTHRLIAMRDAKVPSPRSSNAACRCSSNIASVGDELIRRLEPLYELIHKLDPAATQFKSLARAEALQQLQLAAYQETLFSRLEPIRDVDPNNPFVMATIDPDVVNGHSDIFNARFIDFLIEYIIRSELKRAITVAYRSAERAR